MFDEHFDNKSYFKLIINYINYINWVFYKKKRFHRLNNDNQHEKSDIFNFIYSI